MPGHLKQAISWINLKKRNQRTDIICAYWATRDSQLVHIVMGIRLRNQGRIGTLMEFPSDAPGVPPAMAQEFIRRIHA
jgi:hypothetical protein